MRKFEFDFEGKNSITLEVRIFTIIATSRIGAFDKLKYQYPDWDFIY